MNLSAAFERLCVETINMPSNAMQQSSAAFERLCVETTPTTPTTRLSYSAAFERLCVETNVGGGGTLPVKISRLRAAVC